MLVLRLQVFSTLQNSRVDEGVSCFIKAIQYALENARDGVVKEARKENSNLSRAMFSLREDRFAKWPDDEESSGFKDDLTALLNALATFIRETGEAVELLGIITSAATEINQSVVKAWKEVIITEIPMIRMNGRENMNGINTKNEFNPV